MPLRRCQCERCQRRRVIRREVVKRIRAERSLIRRARTWYRQRKDQT